MIPLSFRMIRITPIISIIVAIMVNQGNPRDAEVIIKSLETSFTDTV
jgi:hypothetical protein